jgi:sulfur transfer complex TusBCD TusB component (DsrH family)
MKRLHILRKIQNPDAENLIAYQVSKGDEVEVILLQDAVFQVNDVFNSSVWACKEDVEARNVTHHEAVLDYGEIIKKIMDAQSVVCW